MAKEIARGAMGFIAIATGMVGMLAHDVSAAVFGLTFAVLTVAMTINR